MFLPKDIAEISPTISKQLAVVLIIYSFFLLKKTFEKYLMDYDKANKMVSLLRGNEIKYFGLN